MTGRVEVFLGVESIVEAFPAVLLDAYGVFWQSNALGLFPGAKEAMERLISSGKIVGILSNSTQLAYKEKEKLQKHGLVEGKHFHFLLTSGEVMRSTLLHKKLPFGTPKQTFFLFGGSHPNYSPHQSLFQGTVYKEVVEIAAADFIYVPVPHIKGEDQTDPAVFREQLESLFSTHTLPMVCGNPDLFAHEGNPPRAVVRQGSIGLLYQSMGGQVFYVGKPYTQAYVFAMECFRERGITLPSSVLMVGDTPETDILGARSFGMSSALITKTGIMGLRVASIGLEKALSTDVLPLSHRPDYFIEKFS